MIPNRNNYITTKSREQGDDQAGRSIKVVPAVQVAGPYLCLGCGQRKTVGATTYNMPNAL